MFFSAQQRDYEGLEFGEGGTHYTLRSGIFWFSVREDVGNLIVAYDAGFTGGKVLELVPMADGSFHADDGTVIGSAAEAKNLMVKELRGWVQRHGVRAR